MTLPKRSGARRRVRLKWTILVLVVALTPLLAATVALETTQRATLAAAERDLELSTVDATAREIDHALHDVELAVHRAAIVLSNARIEEEARLALAQSAIAEVEAVDGVAVFDAKGAPIGAIEKPGRAKPPADALDEASRAESRPRWTGLRFVEPLVVDGATTGYLATKLRGEVFERALVALSLARFGRADRLFLVDRELRIVAADGKTWPRGTVLEGFPLFERVNLVGPTRFSRRVDAHASFAERDGTPMTGTIRVLPDQEWAVVVLRPEAEAFVALHAARRSFALIALVLGVLAILLGAGVARRLASPVERLVDLTRAFAKRRFETKSAVASDDELGELGDALEGMAHELAESEREIRRRAEVESALARYLPAEVANAIATGDSELSLEGRRAKVSVLFADVVAFTPFVERAPPEKVVALLNELFTVLSEIVFRHGGMVDKFMGDCVMAVFGVASGDGATDHVAAALATAEDMHRFIEASASRWREAFDFDVALGIGIATGEAIVGNLGSDRRLEFTAIGDAVNLAARLEMLARPGQTLVTAAVAAEANERFQVRSLGEHLVRGKSAPLEILELAP